MASARGWKAASSRLGYDTTAFFARSGIQGSIPGPEGPARFRPGMGDHTSGLSLFGALMAGLRARDRTGEAASDPGRRYHRLRFLLSRRPGRLGCGHDVGSAAVSIPDFGAWIRSFLTRRGSASSTSNSTPD